MHGDHYSTLMRSALNAFALTLAIPLTVSAQRRPSVATDSSRIVSMATHAMTGPSDSITARHMKLTPERKPTHADSARAMEVAMELKRAIAKYQDTAAAAADGFKMFAPKLKNQPVYHLTKRRNAILEAFRFDPGEPTSLLYKRDTTGRLHLVGAMYTMPKRSSLEQLDSRVPLSIARWHKHVNWCVPDRREQSRWTEVHEGLPVFGPGSPIATKDLCDAVNGNFHETVLGWMIHANVYDGNDLAAIWGSDHHGRR